VSTQCEGWRRYGGAFSLGPTKWKQCTENAIVMLTVKQEKEEELPACNMCWKEAIEKEIKILKVIPLAAQEAGE
jgi:hypothetical protein